MNQAAARTPKILVTDFDGTITRYDFYDLIRQRPENQPRRDYWQEYTEGRLTHFEALAGYFSDIRMTEDALLQLIEAMEPDPELAACMQRLRERGWHIIVASAGCSWYIQQLFARHGVTAEVHANPGELIPGAGLCMKQPQDSPFYSHDFGIDKAAVVRAHAGAGSLVAFAGDGRPDFSAARLVPPAYRFARGWLAHQLDKARENYRMFARWADIATMLSTEPLQGPA